MLRVCANCKGWVKSSYRDAAAGAIGSCLIDGELTGEGHTCNVFDAPAEDAAEGDPETDEQRLGLPEEPPRELYSNLMLLSDHHATWGAAWRKKALELEKDRNFYKQQAETFERVILSERMKAFADCAELERKRDQWKQLFEALVDDVGPDRTAKAFGYPELSADGKTMKITGIIPFTNQSK